MVVWRDALQPQLRHRGHRRWRLLERIAIAPVQGGCAARGGPAESDPAEIGRVSYYNVRHVIILDPCDNVTFTRNGASAANMGRRQQRQPRIGDRGATRSRRPAPLIVTDRLSGVSLSRAAVAVLCGPTHHAILR